MLYILNREKPAKAKILRRGRTSCLVVEFLASTPPLVWQLNLENPVSLNLSLQEKEGEWTLGYVEAGGSFTPIAHFDDRGDAEESYEAISRALLRSEMTTAHRFGRGLLFVFVVIALFFFWARGTGGQREDGDVTSSAPQKPTAALEQKARGAKSKVQMGVPVDADDILSAPR